MLHTTNQPNQLLDDSNHLCVGFSEMKLHKAAILVSCRFRSQLINSSLFTACLPICHGLTSASVSP